MAGERRHTDINVWEKRITLWVMAALVALATGQVVEMNMSVKIIQKDIEISRRKDLKQDERLDTIAKEQTEIKLIQNGHEIRLGNLETFRPGKEKGSLN